ncbi:ABCF4 [Symbiodinium sp. CCMP2456]|nr:ABCF4 [Symbiodinium sp. CCMP2456]
MAEKEKKDKKEKKEKDPKDKKEKKEEKDDKKDKKEKKKRRDEGGLDLWASTVDNTGSFAGANAYGGPKAPQDKREKEIAKEKEIKKDAETKSLIGVSDVITATLKKQHEASRKEAEKRNKAIKAARKVRRSELDLALAARVSVSEEQETKDEADDTTRAASEISWCRARPVRTLDVPLASRRSQEKTEVMDIMKNTVKTAVSQSGVSTRTFMDEKLYTNAQAKFEFRKFAPEEPGVKLTLLRPATVYVALSKAPNEDDPFLRTWQARSRACRPEFSEDIAPIHEVKKKVYRDPDNRNIEVPKPPSGLETCLVFVLPDFHAEMFGEEKLSEEELQEKPLPKTKAGAWLTEFTPSCYVGSPVIHGCGLVVKRGWVELLRPVSDNCGRSNIRYGCRSYGTVGDTALSASLEFFEAESLLWFEKLPGYPGSMAGLRDLLSLCWGDHCSEEEAPSKADEIEAILKKVEAGEKLSNKEMIATNVVYKNEDDEPVGGMNAFSIILEGGKNEPPPSGDAFVCNNFTLSAPKQTLFDNASITIVQGHRYGILGPNGQGKTTLLRHIAAREMPVPVNWDVILVEQEAKATERSAVEEVLAADIRAAELIKREEDLLQKLEDMETAMEKGEEVSAEDLERMRSDLENTSAELEAIGADSAEARVRKILCGLGFTNGHPDEDRFSMDRPVVQFSGGWRMRISLAKALFLQPKLLMLDEPTNHLDLDAVLWLDTYLSEHYPHSVVVVSHDADFLDSICTDILHLEDRKLVHYRGDYTAFKKMHLQKRATLDKEYKKQQDELKALKKKGKTKDEAEALVKNKFGIDALDGLMEKHKDYVVKFKFEGHGMDRSLGLNVSEVAFSYNGKEPWLLDEVEIGVDCGSRIAIVGPNGAGKSTLLNLMMQHLEPCVGDVAVSKGIRIRQYHQHFEELLPLDKTGIEYLTDEFNLGPPEKARAVLGQFGLPGSSHFTKIGNLSGGQKARVAFAALMLMKPHIIILDEPTNHLDIESVEALTTAIANFNGGLVLVSHDARLITEVDCELWVCEDGGCYRFEKDFDGYRDKVLHQLEERQAEVERMEQKRREERAKKRAKHVSEEQLRAAKDRKQAARATSDSKDAEKRAD